MKNDLPTCRADLADMTCIVSASSAAVGKPLWTELSIWYRRGHDRPYVTVIEGRVDELADEAMMKDQRFRALATGTLARAVEVLEPSQLRDDLVNGIPADADELYPDGNTTRMMKADARRAERAYPGRVNLTDALKWLYPDLADGSVNALAQRFEADFDMTARTTRKIIAEERAGMMAPTWVATFVAALRHFDRKSWSRTQ